MGGPNLAVIDKADSGPQFGAEGLSIPLQPIPAGEERLAKTKLGAGVVEGAGPLPGTCSWCVHRQAGSQLAARQWCRHRLAVRAPMPAGPYYKRSPLGTGKSLWGGGGLEQDSKRAQLESLRVYVAASGGANWTLDPGSITWRSTKGGGE